MVLLTGLETCSIGLLETSITTGYIDGVCLIDYFVIQTGHCKVYLFECETFISEINIWRTRRGIESNHDHHLKLNKYEKEQFFVAVNPIDANHDFRLLKLPPNLGPSCSTVPVTTVINMLTAPPLASIQRTVTVGIDGIETTGVLMYAPIWVDWSVECVSTAIAETEQSTTLQLFPNPATSGAAIRYTTSVAGRWTVTDATGRTVLEGRATAGTQQLPTETLSSGLYIFRLTDEAGQVRQEKLLIN